MPSTKVIYTLDLAYVNNESLFNRIKDLIEGYSGKLEDFELNLDYETAEEEWLTDPIDEALKVLNGLLTDTKKSFFLEDCILFGIEGSYEQFSKGNIVHI